MRVHRVVYAMHRHGWATPTGSGVWERLTVDVKISPIADRAQSEVGLIRARLEL